MSHPAALLIVSFALLGQEQDPEGDAKIAAAIQHLGDERFAVREEATQELWRMGLAAEEALQEVAKSRDAEVSTRAKAVLEKLRSGIFVDTPPETVRRIKEYLAASLGSKSEILRYNREKLTPLTRLLLIKNEPDRKARQHLANYFDDELRLGIVEFLNQADLRRTEEVLARLAELETESGKSRRDYAAILLLRGQLDATVTKLTAPREPGQDVAPARLLATLLQVQGDLPQARKAADLSKDRYLQKDIYHRQEDWRALIELDFMPQGQAIETLGFQATYFRLAGDQVQFQRIITTLCNERPGGAWMSAEALMINGCWNEALKLLGEHSAVQAFDLRCVHGTFGEAFQQLRITDPRRQTAAWFIERCNSVGPMSKEAEELFSLGIRLCRALHQLGEQQEAKTLATELQTLAHKDRNRWANLFQLKEEFGLGTEAVSAAAKAVQDVPGMGRLFYDLYGEEGQYLAHEWWQILREQFPVEDAGVTFAKLKTLMNPHAALHPGLNLAENVARAEQGLSKLKVEQRVERLQAMGKLCGIRGSIDLAVACFEKQSAATDQLKAPEFSQFEGYYPTRKVAPWWYMGDAYVTVGEWRKAAEAYDRAWQLDKHNAVTLYSKGFALKQTGDMQGQKLIDLALVLPLANTVKRRELAELMEQHGERSAALAQQELILRLGSDEFWEGDKDWAIRYAERAVADQVEATDPLRAGSLRQLAIMYSLKTNSGYSEAGEYVTAVHQIHCSRAIGLLRAGRMEEAIKEMNEAQRARPGEVDLILAAYPLLANADRNTDALKHFKIAFDALDKVCKDFPKSAHHHHELARLCAGTGQKLTEAETHARAAAKLHPANISYTLTLADVYANSGERDKAVELLQDAIGRHPRHQGLRKQLEKLTPK